MIDISRTISENPSIFRGVRVSDTPDTFGILWSLLIDIGMGSRSGQTTAENPFQGVGAFGRTRYDAIVRGVGEAVERYALLPPASEPYDSDHLRPSADAPLARLRSHRDGIHLTATGADPSPRRAVWERGLLCSRPLETGTSIAVDRELVDYPHPGPEFASWDSTPSGAAAGPSLQFATRSAFLELVERDAVMKFWYGNGNTGAARITPDYRVSLVSGYHRVSAERVLHEMHELGWRVDLIRLRALDGTPVCLSIVDDNSGTVSVGSKAALRQNTAAMGALVESIQMMHALHSAKRIGVQPTRTAITTDFARLQYWLHPKTVCEARRYLHSKLSNIPTSKETPLDLDSLRDPFDTDGYFVVVDLSHRLPSSMQTMGWHACKVLSSQLTRLCIDESFRSPSIGDEGNHDHPIPHPLA